MSIPGKSFGLKFIPNQSDLFRFIPESVSQANPKKILISFEVNRLKINPPQSEIFNPNQNSIQFNLT